MDLSGVFSGFLRVLLSFFGIPIFAVLVVFVFFGFLFIISFLILIRRPIWSVTPDYLAALNLKYKYHDLLRWLLYDYKCRGDLQDEFGEYGLTVFVGRQGAGKTIAMVEYLQRMKERYPKCLILTNFGCSIADMQITDWRDFMTIRNGTDGVIFALDEIQSEFSSMAWRDFPDNLLTEICQQRKQRVKIVATAQYFTRVAKPLREQSKSVVVCSTLAGRFTRTKEYDAVEYALYMDAGIEARKKLRSFARRSFVQSDKLRSSYDTYEKIERMSRTVFIERPVEV